MAAFLPVRSRLTAIAEKTIRTQGIKVSQMSPEITLPSVKNPS